MSLFLQIHILVLPTQDVKMFEDFIDRINTRYHEGGLPSYFDVIVQEGKPEGPKSPVNLSDNTSIHTRMNLQSCIHGIISVQLLSE